MVPTLSIEKLTVELDLGSGVRPVLEEIDLECGEGTAVALVGESGGGKTMLARSVAGLLPRRARIRSGAIRLRGTDLASLDEREMCRIRGGRVGFVFQDAAQALDPVQTVGGALGEALRLHSAFPRSEIRRRSRDLLEEVALPGGERLLSEYPHRLSGGQRQRVMIAVALAGRPDLLLADEPTASLDKPRENEILELLFRLRRERGLSVLLITHDLRVAARGCDRIAVLYAGRIVEEGPVPGVLRSPGHPYTAALLACRDRRAAGSPPRLPSIAGAAPSLRDRARSSCAFAPRCPEVFDRCRKEIPGESRFGAARVRCFLRQP
ncbi:MAG: ABC transporter ATP-binding protein [Thermoanaerobaculia bacterium]